VSKSRASWLIILLGLLICADLVGRKVHLTPVTQQITILSVFVFGVAVVTSRRYWYTRWLWLTLFLLGPFHVLVLWMLYRLYAEALLTDSIVGWLVGFLELWAFDRSTKFIDRRYGHSFGQKGH
jgi:hypothetical protein